MRSIGHILSVLSLFVLCSCEVKMPDYVMSPQKIEAFLYDYHMIQSMTGRYSSDDYKEKLYYSYIFKKHNISQYTHSIPLHVTCGQRASFKQL